MSVGEKLAEKHEALETIKSKMDFKANIIPILFLATKDTLQKEFLIRDIQPLMLDALGVSAEKKQIEDVFKQRPEWFELTCPNPGKY